MEHVLGVECIWQSPYMSSSILRPETAQDGPEKKRARLEARLFQLHFCSAWYVCGML